MDCGPHPLLWITGFRFANGPLTMHPGVTGSSLLRSVVMVAGDRKRGTMSALVVIVCDQCGDTGSLGHTPKEARAEQSAWGRRHGKDLCPLCRLLAESEERLGASAR